MGEAVRITVHGKVVPWARVAPDWRAGKYAPRVPRKTADYQDHIRQRATIAMVGKPQLIGAVSVRIMVNILPPESWSKKRRGKACVGEILPAVKPDLDNYVKSALDACNKIVFKDDGQVTDLIVTKRYAAVPSLIMTVSEIAAVEKAKAA